MIFIISLSVLLLGKGSFGLEAVKDGGVLAPQYFNLATKRYSTVVSLTV